MTDLRMGGGVVDIDGDGLATGDTRGDRGVDIDIDVLLGVGCMGCGELDNDNEGLGCKTEGDEFGTDSGGDDEEDSSEVSCSTDSKLDRDIFVLFEGDEGTSGVDDLPFPTVFLFRYG